MYQGGLQPQIILLREGTDTSQGIAQLISNINACEAVGETVKSTLGPRGMDKLIFNGRHTTVSNDGATIMKELDIVHPAAKALVDISLSQDAEVGDGTTSVVLLAVSFLKAAKPFIEDGVPAQTIIRSFRKAALMGVARLKETSIAGADPAEKRAMLIKCAGTAMNSKLIARNKGYFAPIVVSCVEKLDKSRDLSLVGIKKIPGGALQDSVMVEGVAFKKTFSYAGFEQMQKKYDNPKILLLNVELELKSEKENAEIRISDATAYQEIVDAEWKIIYEKLDKCVACGAQVILSKLPIGDLGTQYFADRGLFCAGRVEDGDMTRTARATGAVIQTSVFGIDDSVLGKCELFEEKQMGDERYNVFTGCAKAESATILLRGGSEQFIEESQRSIWDALMVVKRCMDTHEVVAGGGAIEMELSRHLKEHAKTISGKSQLLIGAYAKAFEIVPRQLSDNAGFDSTDILNQLRTTHADSSDKKHMYFGVDVNGDGQSASREGVWGGSHFPLL